MLGEEVSEVVSPSHSPTHISNTIDLSGDGSPHVSETLMAAGSRAGPSSTQVGTVGQPRLNRRPHPTGALAAAPACLRFATSVVPATSLTSHGPFILGLSIFTSSMLPPCPPSLLPPTCPPACVAYLQAEPSGSQATSPQLSAEQQAVVELVKAGKSVFFTGDAGKGKSFLLNHIISQLREQHGEEFSSAVAITAATGIAATHIQGSTLHSALGCGLPRTTDDFGRMWKRENRERLRGFKVGQIAHQPLCLPTCQPA